MPAPAKIDPEHLDGLKSMGAEADQRARIGHNLDRYYEGDHPLAEALAKQAQKADGAYALLKALASENWAGTIADSELDRLRQIGYRRGQATDDLAWVIHKRNNLPVEQRLANLTSLVHGRSFAIVWDENGDGLADITYESPDTCVVEYESGSRVRRRRALRRWCGDDGVWYATLFYPHALFKFRALNGTKSKDAPTSWEPFEVEGEPWPLPNPFGRVPVVERPLNRPPRVRPGPHRRFGAASGVFQRHLALIDRINYTVFCGLAGLTWSGFQGLALVGDPITRDPKTQKPIQPFEYAPGKILQIANPEGKVVSIPAADLEGFLKHAGDYIARLAAVSATPAYKMNTGQFINVSSDSFRVLDDSFNAKCVGHQTELGGPDEEIMQLALALETGNFDIAAPEIIWSNVEMTTLAAKADATAKLSAVFPWQVIAEEIWDKSPETIAQWQAMKSSEDMLAAALAPPPAPGSAPPATTAPAATP